jgi:hypothetical protein
MIVEIIANKGGDCLANCVDAGDFAACLFDCVIRILE